jgi:hypothetical protein
MAQLSSPGVSVTVVDESFYTPSAPGTVPLIIVASQENKQNAAGTGTAVGTLKANAGKVYLMTSQMDLGTTFGIPFFQTDASNNPVHAGEINEYGLQAAYSFLGVSNRAYVVRADLNTSQLQADAIEPTGAPDNGTMWLDVANTSFGIFEWNSASATTTGGQSFTKQTITVITDVAQTTGASNYAPLPSIGQVGDYVLVSVTNLNKLWMKKYLTDTAAGTWVEVGSPAWKASWPTAAGTVLSPTVLSTGTSFTGYIPQGTTRLSVISAVTGSAVAVGQVISGSNVLANTRITAVVNQAFTGFISNGTSGVSGTVLTALTGTPSLGLVLSGGTITAYTYITAQNTAIFTGTIVGTALTTSAPTGTITVGMVLSGGTVSAGTYIVSGSGSSWVVNNSQNTTATTGTTWTVSTAQTAGTAGSPVSITGTSYTIDDAPTAGTVNGAITTGGDTLVINGTTISGTNYANLATAINDAGITGVTASELNGYLQIYSTGVNVVLSGTIPALVGLSSTTYLAPKLQISAHTSVPTYKTTENTGTANGNPTGSIWVKTTSVNQGADWIIKKYSSAASSWIEQPVRLFANNASALAALDSTGGLKLAANTVYVKYNDDEGATPYANFKIYGYAGGGPTSVRTSAFTATVPANNTYGFTLQQSLPGTGTLAQASSVNYTLISGTATARAQTFIAAVLAATNGDANVAVVLNSDNSVTITHTAGGDIHFVDGGNTPLAGLFTVGTTANWYNDQPTASGSYIATLWRSMNGTSAFAPASATAPTTIPADGTLWYNSVVDEVDLMIHDGSKWVGYLNYNQSSGGVGYGADRTDPAGPTVSATAPTTQSDGTALAHGDIWVDTSDFDNYPHIYKFNFLTKKWVLVDNADQTTENGIVFHDARWTSVGGDSVTAGTGTPASISTLLSSNFVDTDAPDPALYPKGMLLWNLRRSGNNVLKFVKNYIDVTERNTRFGAGAGDAMTYYYPHRWVSQASNQLDGSGTFGRKSQRSVVLNALNELINSNQQIRDEDSRQFNLLACPGYLETLSTLIDLNTSRGETAFIVADTPARLTPDATSLSNWGQNVDGAAVDGELGLIAANAYAAVYYPWGYTTDLTGNNIVVPPSHIMLRTIALSDNVSYPWFAPAGVRRGGVTNASSVGYVDPLTGEFNTVALNTGQRDTLAGVHVNPITYIAGTGLVAYGQKTRQLIASSLDRINVARLVIYLRYQLNQIAKPYVFEPNDTQTRNEIKNQIESMLLELTGQRALYDYIVVCDTSNNTPSRIDANELHVDIAIEPVKAVEFIYIPLRLENTGGVKALG